MRRPVAVALILAAALLGAAPPASRAAEDGGTLRKLDPFLRRVVTGTRVVEGRFGRAVPPRSSEIFAALPPQVRRERGAIPAALFVKARRADGVSWEDLEPALRSLGVQVRGRVGAIAALRVPPAALEGLAALPQIDWIKAARAYRPQNEISTDEAHVASDGAASVFGARGAGAIVVVVDTGVDWRSADFRDAAGNTRLLGIWDQTVTSALHPPPAGFGFGSFFSRAAIDAALDAGTTLPTGDGHGHGSHVTGSAAGNGRQTGNGIPSGTFAGVAPEADLLVVRIFDDVGAFCDACDLTAAMQFASGVAAAAGKPYVVNMSLGTDLGSHDGTDPDELSIDAAVGPGTKGAQAVIAAGNSQLRGNHWEGTLTTVGTTSSTSFSVPNYQAAGGSDNDFFWLDVWYEGADQATIEIATPGGSIVRAARGADSGIVCTSDGAVQVDATNAPDAANGDNEVFIQVWDSGSCGPVVAPRNGTWTLRVRADGMEASGPHDFDAWNEAAVGAAVAFAFNPQAADETIGVPSTGRHALSAASYVSKCSWINVNGTTTSAGGCTAGAISSFSSSGPTRDGRAKPDLAAPGSNIGSTLAGSLRSLSSLFIERDGQHGVISGTSMATPHVAGIAALLFGLEPDRTGGDVKAAMLSAARLDSFTGTVVPTVRWGYGKARARESAARIAGYVTDLGAAPGSAFRWTSNPLCTSYRVYRGGIPGLSATNYGTCFRNGLTTPEFTDAETPAAGAAFFYLTAGLCGGVEGFLGADSSGQWRTVATPCP